MGRERYSRGAQDFYRLYLGSAQWRAKKNDRIRRAGGQCEFVITRFAAGGKTEARCPRRTYLCVHHNTYERLGQEWDQDLDVYCWPHHMLEHLLYKRCRLCGEPALMNDAAGEVWLVATLAAMGLDVDHGGIPWHRLPNKEVLLAQIPSHCPRCKPQFWKGDE
jgi:hypothetical protein